MILYFKSLEQINDMNIPFKYLIDVAVIFFTDESKVKTLVLSMERYTKSKPLNSIQDVWDINLVDFSDTLHWT